jgi:hypothetical protein
MQENIRLMIFTAVGVVIVWFIIMIIDVHVFLHSDINETVSGNIPMSRTDIGDRCGSEYVNSNTVVDYKLNMEGQIVYLCPTGISPIRSRVTAMVIPEAFRRSLTPAQQAKVLMTYPGVIPPSPSTIPASQGGQRPAPIPQSVNPPPISNTPPPIQNSSVPVPTAAEPAS